MLIHAKGQNHGVQEKGKNISTENPVAFASLCDVARSLSGSLDTEEAYENPILGDLNSL